MARLPRLFARRQQAAVSGASADAERDDQDLFLPSGAACPPALAALLPDDPLDEAMPTGAYLAPAVDADPMPPIGTERRAANRLIGGEEDDLVPVIPDTAVEFNAPASEFDEDAAMEAAVDALMAACSMMVERVKLLRRLQDGTQIVAGLIALVTDLDQRYAQDWGVIRRNGLNVVLNEVRAAIPEGDLFILESLEDGQGGLTAEAFLRDLRTIAESDRPRMVSHYASFLVFVLQCVLRQYLLPLQREPARLRDMSRRLEYLIDGVRDSVLARINGIP
jgi:hypothetical protein